MRIRQYFIFLLLVLVGCATATKPSNHVRPESELPFTMHYKVDAYLQTAIDLQSLGRDAALQCLHSMARTNSLGLEATSRIYVLCRMLFEKRQDSEFREPWLGSGVYLGGTQDSDWLLTPIEIVEGIPFLINRGYLLAGLRERPDKYLTYCETNCDWSALRFSLKTDAEKQGALEKLLSRKWKWPLDKYEHQFLSEQIQ